jgi:hypothetical protein
MGLVEVGGNGSVVWYAEHDDGSDGHGNKFGGWGRDKKPDKGKGETFTVKINGVIVGQPVVDVSKIVITWGKDKDRDTPSHAEGDIPVDQNKVKARFDQRTATGGGTNTAV